MEKKVKKLVLERETVRQLTKSGLENFVGGTGSTHSFSLGVESMSISVSGNSGGDRPPIHPPQPEIPSQNMPCLEPPRREHNEGCGQVKPGEVGRGGGAW